MTRSHASRRSGVLLGALLLALSLPAAAQACSRDDTAWFETFLDTSCLVTPLTSTGLDALGGLRLVTNGVPLRTSWDTDGELAGGVTWESKSFAPVGVGTLAVTGSGTAAALALPATLLPLDRGAGASVLGPSSSAVLDGDGVTDPSVVRIGGTYRMWYTGLAESGGASVILEATSPDGAVWTRQNAGAAVLAPTPGTFDAHGTSAPHVVYDATDAVTPYRMWYAGQGDVYGAIGYATSTDGVAWTKHDDPGTPAPADPVLQHGEAGSADSFAAGDPSVLHDGATWKLWYTGDDSSKKRIAYATSPDGVVWTKGGKVIAPEDPGANANYSFGAFAPTVWKPAAGGYRMLLTGRKLVSGSTFQTKVMDASSTDGIAWSAPSPSVNPAGNSSKFDYSNLDAPFVLSDPGSGAASFKLWYAGNTVDVNGNFHTRIGYATSSGGASFGKVAGAQPGTSVLDAGTAGTTFDARSASGLSVVAATGSTPKFAGFASGVRGSDFKPRLGLAMSADGDAWTKVPVSAPDGGALFPLSANGFDQNGERDPAAIYDVNSGAGTDDWFLFFTGLGASATSIGRASAPEAGATKLPDATAWSARSSVLAGAGSGFDAAAVDHPSVIKDGPGVFIMFYGATDGSGNRTIGRVSAPSVTGSYTARTQVLTAGAGAAFDAGGVKDPVVTKPAAGDYRMTYTGIDPATGIERIGYATSADGLAWTKRGVVLPPSGAPFAADERGVRPSGMLVDGATLHVWAEGRDRTGRATSLHLTTAFPSPVAPASGIANGSATYQLGDTTTSVRDFRHVVRTSTGSGVTLWLSFLQPYSSAGSEFWSDWFPVTSSASDEDLRFLLTVRGVRWQARLSGAAGLPRLDGVAIDHAPVSFATAGQATTVPILPPDGQLITTWGQMTAAMAVLQPGGSGSASGTLTVVDAQSGAALASTPLNVGGTTSMSLFGVSATDHPALRARFDLAGDGAATPVVQSLKLLYNAAAAPPAPPAPLPPPPPVLTLSASPLRVVYGQPIALSGVLSQSGVPVAGGSVSVLQRAIGAVSASAAGTATTDAAGAFTVQVRPEKHTVYTASFGAAAQPAVTVDVAPLVTLSVKRTRTRGVFKGKVAPAHPGTAVTIQVRRGTSWTRYAKVRTSATSTFLLRRRGLRPRAKYRFRAVLAADAEHLAGTSAEAYVDRMKVALTVTVKARRATFTGVVSPRHSRLPVTIKVLRAGRLVTFARTRLSRTSRFRLVKRLAPGAYVFQAVTGDDRDHFGGLSAERSVVVR